MTISVAIMAAVGLLVTLSLLQKLVVVCRPNQMLVISGRSHKLANGEARGYRVLTGGWAVKVPFVERVDIMDLRNFPVNIRMTDVYTKGGVLINVHAIANVKLSDSPMFTGNAIERFLTCNTAQLQQIAQENLEGHVRGVIGTLTPEQVNEDRLTFARALDEQAGDDLNKLGLHLDTLKIQSVSDGEGQNYLASIGRESIATVKRRADVAEYHSTANAEGQEATARRQSEVANAEADRSIVIAQNSLRQLKAELEARASSEEERTEQIALETRAQAEQDLQRLRAEVERTRLQADKVLPAEYATIAAELKARGAAAAIDEQGKALAAVLTMLAKVWKEAGPEAREVFLIQNLDSIMRSVVSKVGDVQIDEVQLLDDGQGQSMAAYAASYPAMVRSVLDELRTTTGVDILNILQPEEK